MKTVIQINLSRLRNAEYYLLIQSILGRFNQPIAEELKFEALIGNLKEAFDRFEITFLSNQSSILTPEIQQADRARDDYFIGLGDIVKALDRLGNEEEKRAAAAISHAMRPYINTPRATMNENTAQLKAFIYDMSQPGNLYNINVLKLADKISALEDLNVNFDDLLHARTENKVTSEQVGKLVELRKEIDPAYRAVVDRVNALYMIAYQDKDEVKEPQLSELIDNINIDIRIIQDTVNKRLSRQKNAKEKKEEGEETKN
jgi:hypothetical protein